MLDKLKEHKELIPILTIALYIVGFIYYISYYLSFNIDIIPYISLSEVLVYSIIGVAVFCIIVIPIEYLVQKVLSSIYNKKNTVSYLISWLFHFTLFSIFLYFSFKNHNMLMMVACIIINFMWVYFTVFFITNYKFNLSRFTPVFCLLFGVIMGVISISILGDASAYFVVNNEQKYKIEIETDNGNYSTIDDVNLYLVGETSAVYFLYDKNVKSSIIINKGSINKVVIPNSIKE